MENQKLGQVLENYDNLTQQEIKWKFDNIELGELKGNRSNYRVRVNTRKNSKFPVNLGIANLIIIKLVIIDFFKLRF